MVTFIQTIKNSYYTYQPNEFLPVFSGHDMLNKRAFHLYKLRNWRLTYHQLTHFAG